uniref:Uncharacterized protein n=1 Tax=Marseillevirus LCMAC201 TaxID=2506605 RepID=A0A481YX39_9VIRU|nr:MAG: hypothetical protein LCMAC201_00360 [Marseillevirus LCMAC201]
MSEQQPTDKSSWFFMQEYPVQPDSTKEPTLMECLTVQQKEICKLHKLLEDLDVKLEKLIESNKSLIAYFGAMNERDARDLNYRIRGFSSNKHLPPTSFVPARRNKPI